MERIINVIVFQEHENLIIAPFGIMGTADYSQSKSGYKWLLSLKKL